MTVLLIDIGNKQVLPSVAVIIGSIHAHARARPARLAIGDPCGQSGLFEFPVAFIDEKKIGHRIIADKQIHQPVVINIGRDHAE